ncbi:MAG TPA: VOC family protein [Thermodesulfobacteriota bacterium]|nr:VOC family protein [Thermodesulfobacteriota bacterium]
MANIKRIDHVAVAVRDADQAAQQFVKLLNAVPIRTEILQEKAGPVKVAYLKLGDSIITMIQSMDADGFINQHIAKNGEGMHHMGLEVDNLDEFVREIEGKGFKVPLRDNFSNRREVVLRPRDSAGVVLQIMEWEGGTETTLEQRVDRIRNLQNVAKKD